MQTLCELLARALETGVLSAADLEGTEPALIARLEASPLSGDWLRFRALSRTLRAVTPPDQRPWRQIPAKKRRIDPLVAQRGRLSALDPAFRDAMCSFLAEDQRNRTRDGTDEAISTVPRSVLSVRPLAFHIISFMAWRWSLPLGLMGSLSSTWIFAGSI